MAGLWARTSPDVHVYPVGDMREHVLERTCWCQPKVFRDDVMIASMVTHNSLDGRELIERNGIQ